MSREGRHRAERGDQAAQSHRDRLQRMAAGLPMGEGSQGGPPGAIGGGLGASTKSPLNVSVVSGQQEFFEKLSRALGLTTETSTGVGGLGALTQQFQAMVTGQQAQTQLMNQFVKQQQITNQMLRDLSTGLGGAPGGGTRVGRGVVPPGYGDYMPAPTAYDLDTKGYPLIPYNPYQGNQSRTPAGSGSGGSLRRALNNHYSNTGATRPAQHYKFGAEGGHGTPMSLGGLRRMAAKGIHTHVGMGSQPVLHKVSAVDSGGNPYTQYIREDTNGQLSDITGDSAQIDALSNIPASRQLSSTFASGLAEGGVVGGMRAIPAIGLVATAAEGVNSGAEWLTNQRAANAQYQSIYNQGNVGNIFSDLGSFFSGGSGGSTSGLGNRMGQEGFVLANRFSAGGLDSQSAQQLYQGVASLGWSGNQQAQALQLGQQGYSSMGMPVDQWMQAVSISAQNLNGDLANLSQQLSTVSSAAVSTGQNANTLRDALISNYQSVSAMVTGAGASSLAGALTMANAGTSRAFAGMSESGMLSNPVTMNMIASSQGMGANQILYQAAQGNVQPLATGIQSTETSLLGNITSPAMKAALSKYVAAHGGQSTVLNSPNTLQEAGMQMMNASNIPPSMLPQYMQSIGMTPGASLEDDYAKIAQTMLGNGVGGAAAAGGSSFTSLSAAQTRGASQISAHPTGYTSITTGGQAGAAQALKANQSGWTASDIGQSGTAADTSLQTWFTANTNAASTAAVAAYGQVQSKYKTSDPAISNLIQSIGSDPNVGITVTTSKGDETVSLDNAIRLFPDQIASGTATIVGGSDDGKSVGEVVTKDTGKSPYKSTTSSAPVAGGVQGSGKTTSAQAWAKAHPDAGTQNTAASSNTSGTITIDLTPAAQQLVTATMGSSSDVSSANALGTVPQVQSGVNY
jgi:hypothetical protein